MAFHRPGVGTHSQPDPAVPLAALAGATLDAMPDHVAVLDPDGRIIAVNEAWERFAQQNGATDPAKVGVGASYLQVCRRAAERGMQEASEALAGLEAVLAGGAQGFHSEYACHSGAGQRWFRMVVTRPQLPQGGVVVVHCDISSLKRAEHALTRSLRFEHLLAELSRDFVALRPAEVDSRIELWLRRLAESFRADYGACGEFLPGPRLRIAQLHCRPGLPPLPRAVLDDPPRWTCARLLHGEIVSVSNLEELPPEAAADLAQARELGLKSVLALPLEAGGMRIGYVALATVQARREWPPELQQQLGMVREVFANALQRKHQDLELRTALGEIQKLKERLEAENDYLREEIHSAREFADIVGKSSGLRDVLDQVSQVAPTDATVLLMGETGTGKELLARAVHAHSPRRDHPFITVNCAALPAALIESELFGHEKGAFTGALLKKIGRFELADGGTLFLDEVAELAPELQSKLLRVLQGGTFERLGSNRTEHVNVRIVAATNRDLAMAMLRGTFRPDLYYRLSVFPIQIPPLRERPEDIPLLISHFIALKQRRLGRSIERVPPEAMRALQDYDWPGNIRELENVIEHALILSPGGTLRVETGFASGRPAGAAAPVAPAGAAAVASQRLDVVEREHILEVLNAGGWRIKGEGGAADRLGIHPSTLYFRMKKHGISRPPFAPRNDDRIPGQQADLPG